MGESPGALQSGGSYEKNRYNWGCGIVRHDRSRVEGGIYMAHNIAGSCSLWNVQIKDPEVAAGKLGDMEHMRDVLGEGEDMKPGEIYWLTDATPHESRPGTEDCNRQFFRLVAGSLSAWYPEHCTANALVELDPTTQIVHGSKFEEDYASREGVSASGPDFEQLMGRSPQRRELWLRGLSICLTRHRAMRVAHLYSPCAKVTAVHLE